MDIHEEVTGGWKLDAFDDWNVDEGIGRTTFYTKGKYSAQDQCFIMMVMMAKDPESAAQYTAHFSMSNKSGLEATYKCPVVSIEETLSWKEMMQDYRCWRIPLYVFKDLAVSSWDEKLKRYIVNVKVSKN